MSNFKIGNWIYSKNLNVIQYRSKTYTYEIDLDREDFAPEDWVEHLVNSKNNTIMPIKDIHDLVKCFLRLELKTDQEKIRKFLSQEFINFWRSSDDVKFDF